MVELDDQAGIFEREVAESFHLMEYAVRRDPDRLAYAQRVMTEAMLRVIDRQTTGKTRGRPAGGAAS